MNLSAIATPSKTPACWNTPEIFADPALDYSPHDEDYAHLSPEEAAVSQAAKVAAEEACVNTCYDCPLMLQCENLDVETHATAETLMVSGVIAGRTERERADEMNVDLPGVAPENYEDEVLLPKDRGARNKINEKAVLRYSNQNLSIDEIAAELQCSVRSVTRARARLNLTKNARVPVSA